MADVLQLLRHQFKATEIVFPMHDVIVDVDELHAALPDLRDPVGVRLHHLHQLFVSLAVAVVSLAVRSCG